MYAFSLFFKSVAVFYFCYLATSEVFLNIMKYFFDSYFNVRHYVFFFADFWLAVFVGSGTAGQACSKKIGEIGMLVLFLN